MTENAYFTGALPFVSGGAKEDVAMPFGVFI